MVSVDIYLNETSRHANVILPSPSHLYRSHYDLALLNFGLRSVANYSEPVFDLPVGMPDEWEILARLAGIAQGLGPDVDPATVDDVTIRSLIDSAVRDESCVIHNRSADEIFEALSGPANGSLRGPDRILDLTLEEIGDRVPVISGVWADGSANAAKIARMAQQRGASAQIGRAHV